MSGVNVAPADMKKAPLLGDYRAMTERESCRMALLPSRGPDTSVDRMGTGYGQPSRVRVQRREHRRVPGRSGPAVVLELAIVVFAGDIAGFGPEPESRSAAVYSQNAAPRPPCRSMRARRRQDVDVAKMASTCTPLVSSAPAQVNHFPTASHPHIVPFIGRWSNFFLFVFLSCLLASYTMAHTYYGGLAKKPAIKRVGRGQEY